MAERRDRGPAGGQGRVGGRRSDGGRSDGRGSDDRRSDGRRSGGKGPPSASGAYGLPLVAGRQAAALEAGRDADAELGPDADPEAVARQICLRMLSAAPRTQAQLATALRRRGVPEEAAAAVLARFAEVKLIDDA